MYKVGIFGHRAGDFHLDPQIVQYNVNDVLGVLNHQYKSELLINTDVEPGVGEMVVSSCNDFGIKYHLYLVCPTTTNHNAFGITIRANTYSLQYEIERDQRLVDDSAFLVCFWEGKHQGRTFNLLKYALAQNKIVLNGLDELKLITSNDLRKRKAK